MLKIYCQDCGSPTSYTSVKPKFCSSCGKSFEKNMVVNKVQLQAPTITKLKTIKKQVDSSMEDFEGDDYDENDGIDHVPDINKIDIEISDVRPKKVKMGDIVSNIPEEAFSAIENIKINKNKKNKNSVKKNRRKNPDFLKEFKSEAGTLRPSYKRNRDEIDG